MKPCPKPVKQKRKKRAPNPNSQKELEKRLEALVRKIVFWRDSGKCIEADIDGGRCSDVLQWGHWIARKQSAWMKLTLATFVQCSNHNGLEYHGDKTMTKVVSRLLGQTWIDRVTDEQMAHRGQKPNVDDLKARIQICEMLWEHRPIVYDTARLLELGYYG